MNSREIGKEVTIGREIEMERECVCVCWGGIKKKERDLTVD